MLECNSMDLLSLLNDRQKEAVTYDKGPLLVLAGAGSGKTRVLTHRAAWLVGNKKAKPEELLMLTFTNKAAGEMKKRLNLLLKTVTSQKAGGSFAGTFHSFCAYMLRRDGRCIGVDNNFVIYDENDQQALVKKIIKQHDLNEKEYKPRLILSVISGSKNKLMTPEDVAAYASNSFYEKISRVYKDYQKEMEKMQALDFDDLLFKTVELLREDKKVRAKYRNIYKYLLIDEYQDTNQAQYRITKLLAGKNPNLTVVGDASQAIYSWRGANYQNILSLEKDFPSIYVINLERNYRSSQTILDAAYNVISRNQNHPILKLWTENNTGNKITVYKADSETDEAGFVADEIKKLTDFYGVDPTEIVVLYRTNAQSRVFEEMFLQKGIPYVLIGGLKFYDRAEIKDLLSLLKVALNPKDEISWDRIKKNMGVRRTQKVKEFLKNHKAEKIKPFDLIEQLLEVSTYLEKFDPDDEDDYRKIENMEELKSVATKFNDLGSFLENMALVQQEYSQQEKQKDKLKDTAVKLMTIHSSKGLEFENVFLVGMEEGLLPHAQNIEDKEKLEEERRLCYVGMTRAKKRLYFTFASRRMYFGQTNYNAPSQFLLDIPDNLLNDNSFRKEDDIWEDDFDDDEDDW